MKVFTKLFARPGLLRLARSPLVAIAKDPGVGPTGGLKAGSLMTLGVGI